MQDLHSRGGDAITPPKQQFLKSAVNRRRRSQQGGDPYSLLHRLRGQVLSISRILSNQEQTGAAPPEIGVRGIQCLRAVLGF